VAYELDNPHRGEACFILHASGEVAEKVQLQIDKLIEVEQTTLTEGVASFYNEVQAASVE
jgi:hypothetical protein